MADVILITGGARSGKSTHALKLADSFNASGEKAAFIATAVVTDDEMKERILKHKEERGNSFDTFEEPETLLSLLESIINIYDCIIVDCLTFFINNLIFKDYTDDEILKECDLIIESLKNADGTVIFVTNEVGLGIVPENQLARRFRDISGRVNQKFAGVSGEVYFMVSGIPMRLN